MGHQGGKIRDKKEREKFFQWLEKLEYENFEMPRPDAVIFFHMPYQASIELKKQRAKKSEYHPGEEDGHESSQEHLKNAEQAYLHLSDFYRFIKIECTKDGTINSLRTPEDIFREFYQHIEIILSKN
jgi:thymidylate kinase